MLENEINSGNFFIEETKNLLKLPIKHDNIKYLLKIIPSKDNISLIFKLEKEKIQTYYYYAKYDLDDFTKLDNNYFISSDYWRLYKFDENKQTFEVICDLSQYYPNEDVEFATLRTTNGTILVRKFSDGAATINFFDMETESLLLPTSGIKNVRRIANRMAKVVFKDNSMKFYSFDTHSFINLNINGNFVIIETNDIAPVGRAAQGIRAIKLSLDDFVIDSKVIKKDDKFVVVVSKNGLIKKTLLSEYPVNNRNIKGKRISDIKDGDRIEKFLTLGADCDIIIVSERKTIKISTSEIRELSRAAVGVKSISLDSGDYVKDLRGEASES
jgi:DNA gyrase/topoisomerase IV subunit A